MWKNARTVSATDQSVENRENILQEPARAILPLKENQPSSVKGPALVSRSNNRKLHEIDLFSLEILGEEDVHTTTDAVINRVPGTSCQGLLEHYYKWQNELELGQKYLVQDTVKIQRIQMDADVSMLQVFSTSCTGSNVVGYGTFQNCRSCRDEFKDRKRQNLLKRMKNMSKYLAMEELGGAAKLNEADRKLVFAFNSINNSKMTRQGIDLKSRVSSRMDIKKYAIDVQRKKVKPQNQLEAKDSHR